MTKNKYYVYLHRNYLGVVFYVGKGTRDRASHSYAKTSAWKLHAEKGWTYQILKEGLTNQEALRLEESLIEIYKSTCVNVNKSGVVKEIHKVNFADILSYDENSPSGLIWTVERLCGRGGTRLPVGSPAGTLDVKNKKRGWRVKVRGCLYYAHRIIWVLQRGDLDSSLVIDHLDGNPHNNNISNLTPKTQADNNRNTFRKVKQGKFKGISERTFNGKPNVYYIAYWHDIDGKVKSKCFSANKLGKDEALTKAKNYRATKIKELIQLGHGYTDRHIES